MGAPPSRRRVNRAVSYLLVLVLFALIAVLYTRPLVSQANDHLVGAAGGDNYFNIYVISWDTHALATDPLSLFDATMFYPNQRTLAYSDHELASSLIAAPVLAVTGNGVIHAPPVTYICLVYGGIGGAK